MTIDDLRLAPGEALPAVVERLREHPEQTPRQLTRDIGIPYRSVLRALGRLVAEGQAEKDRYARYRLVQR